MPHSLKQLLSDYWKNYCVLNTNFGNYMSRNRFQILLRFLHFSDNARPHQRDRLWKIRDVVKMIIDRFSRYFVPFRNLFIDESLTLFKGRLVFKQYIPAKRHRFDIKQFLLCDCETGIILDMLVYTGTNIDFDRNDVLGSTGSIVKTLMAPYTDKGHVLYLHSYYSSPDLSRFLHSKQTGKCCTVRNLENICHLCSSLKNLGPVTLTYRNLMKFWQFDGTINVK